MAFVANARPEQSDTHSCSLNKGIGWESRTRKDSLFSVCRLWIIECKGEGRIPKVAVFLKHCFPCKVNLARGENRSLEELSWLREKAEAMRLRKETPMHEWISQKTYKPKKWKKPVRKARVISAYKTQRRWLRQSSFFLIEKILFILTGRCWQVTPPAGTKGSIDTREGSKWINEK